MLIQRLPGLFLLIFLAGNFIGCAPESIAGTVLPTPILITNTPVQDVMTAVASSLPPTPTLIPSLTAPPSPTPTPDPIFPYTISGLRGREYPGGPVEIRAVLEETDAYTRNLIVYPSDGLTITGIMQTPPGNGPFPVIILLHGYFERESYWSGADTWQAAEYLNQHGYLTIAPDFRSWGQSDVGPSLFHSGLVVDTLNLISSLSYLPQADTSRVGLWGHSMGGGIATKVLAVDDRIRAAVLYAPNSADDADLIMRWGAGCLLGQSEAAGDKCNPAEIILPDLPPDVVQAYLAAAADPAKLRQAAPIHHLEHVVAPVQIHIGTADGQGLAETPPEWSQKLYDALLVAEKDATLYTYPDQGHFFTGESWTLFMERTADFFEEHLP